MANEYPRSERIAQLISRGLANLMSLEVSDQRIKSLTVVDVEVTRDLRHADVFVSNANASDQEIEDAMHALKKASGFLRHRLAESVDLKRCPNLHFKYDHSIQRGADLSALIDSVAPKE